MYFLMVTKMSKDRIIRQVRALDSLKLIGSGATFVTLTTADEVDLHGIRRRWRKYRNSLQKRAKRRGMMLRYVMNYELHPGYLIKVVSGPNGGERVLHGTGQSHGWHIHAVVGGDITDTRHLLDKANFGRCDFRSVTSSGVMDYLTKHALKAYRGLTRKERERYRGMRVRLVSTSRGLPRLSDYNWESKLIRRTKALRDQWHKEMEETGGRYDYRRLHQYAEICALMGYDTVYQLRCMMEELLRSGKR